MPERPLGAAVRRFRAPEEDGGVLVWPGWDRVPVVLATNRARLAEACAYDCQGRRFGELAQQARQELLQEAWQWTAGYHDRVAGSEGREASGECLSSLTNQPPGSFPAIPPSEAPPIFLAGHQPELFHPGVWLKNLALDRLARQHQAVAVNLIVDHDVPHSVQIRTPTGTWQQPAWVEIPLDAPVPGVPYEDRPLRDWTVFEAFGRRASEALQPLVADPMLREFWPLVLERARQTGRLGSALAQARHQWEIRWGSRTLEVPLGRLCQGEPFLWFVGHLVARLPWIHEHYNTILADYRRAHRIRNPAQPLPNLRAEDDWLEAPLWIWSAQEPIRRPLYARPQGNRLLVSDRTGRQLALPITPEADLARAVAMLQELSSQGLRFRPKAWLTTLWARLALGDLFIHGIGGARYDQITDELIRRWMGLEPPQFLVLSGTLYLPIAAGRAARDKWFYVQKQLRELTWHPERFLNCRAKTPADGLPPPKAGEPETLVAEKWRWIQTPVTPENARTRFLAIRRINQALQTWLAEEREKLLAHQAALQAQIQADRILRRRDWPFCYYPEKRLQEFFAGALQGMQ